MTDTDPDTLEGRIERTRAELAKTVDAIADRVSPKKVAGRSVAKMKSQVKAQTEHVVSTIGDMVGNPAAQSPNGHRPAEEPWDDDYPATPAAPVLIAVGAVVVIGALIVIMRRRRR
ncbi:DUF3618 domain-containing protein [Herbidospora cretacea]|uniref:DUF3618 domain-containing protein n=1 Tax=Herbidospora cretacea TaxID=28444 RepID=UPI000773F1DA|nr:DUF3618 domain-containing protein [Herbidospora cretacea]